MSIYKPAKSRFWHYDFQHKGHRFHGSTGQTTRAKALGVEAAQREAAALEIARSPDGKPAPRRSKAPTLDAAAQEWWEWKGKHLGKPADEEARATRLEAAVKFVGADMLVTEIRTADIAEAIRKRRGKLVRGRAGAMKVPANATVNRDIIDTIRPVIRRACKLLEVAPPPIDWGEMRLKERKPKPREIIPADFERLLAVLPEWYHDAARFQRRYACRVSELFFTPDDLDIEGGRVRLRDRKGDDDHIVPIVAGDLPLLAALKGRAQAAKLNTIWFRVLKGGQLKPLTRAGVVRRMSECVRKAGLHASQGAKGTHDLRRTGAIRILRATRNLATAKRLLGHSSITSTMVYADVVEDDLREGLEALVDQETAAASPAAKDEPTTTDDPKRKLG